MRRIRSITGLFALASVLGALAGCGPNFGPKAANGIVFYCPGVSNTDFGDIQIRQGLEQAGFTGEVNTFFWTVAPIPIVGVVIDQYAKYARLRAGELARNIETYVDKFPGRPVHVIGLSAGTGVALWGISELKEGYSVDNVVLLSSSLSSTFDVRPAMKRVRGRVYVYYSPNDPVLNGPMRFAGTIDGVFTGDAAGLIGFNGPGSRETQLHNIPYSSSFAEYGYYGGHTDSVVPAFIRAEVAPKLVHYAARFHWLEIGAPSRLASVPPPARSR